MDLRSKSAVGGLFGLLILTIGGYSQSCVGGPAYTNNGGLVRPSGYRKWVFVGGSITPNGLNNWKAPFPEFHSVYVELENLRPYQKNGKFPEGTLMVKALSRVQPGGHPDGLLDSASGRGYFSGPNHGMFCASAFNTLNRDRHLRSQFSDRNKREQCKR